MSKVKAVPEVPETDLWETRALGCDENFVERAPVDLKKEIDSALGMQMVSMRLQSQLVEALKVIADYRGIGYQPLIRDVLGRFAKSEIIQIAKELQEYQRANEAVTTAAKKRA